METDTIRDVEEIQRHRLHVYRSQITPAWAWPSFAVAVLLLLSSYELDDTWVHVAAPAAFALFCAIWAGLVRARSGVQPRLRGMPSPLLGEVVRACVCGLALLAAAVAIGQLVSFVLAGVLAGVAAGAGGQAYDRRYRRRADALAGEGGGPVAAQ